MKRKLIFFIIVFLLSAFTVPALADGVYVPKKNKKAVSRKILKKAKKSATVSRIRAIVRYKYIEAKNFPPIISAKPKIVFQVACSEEKYIFIRVNVAVQAAALLEGQKLIEASFNNTQDDWAFDYNAMIRVARFLHKSYLPDSMYFRSGALVFAKPIEEVNFSIILSAFRMAFPEHDPYEVFPRYGCQTAPIALKN